MKQVWDYLLEMISLQTPKARVTFVTLATLLIYCAPYAWLTNLSLYKHLGIHSPSIGLTRAYWLFIHGRPTDAWVRNWLIYPVMAVGFSIVALDVRTLLRAERNKHFAN